MDTISSTEEKIKEGRVHLFINIVKAIICPSVNKGGELEQLGFNQAGYI